MKHLINCTKLVDSMIEIFRTNNTVVIESIYLVRISIFCRNYLAYDTTNLWLLFSSSLRNYFLDPNIYLTCFHDNFKFYVLQDLHGTASDLTCTLPMGVVHSSATDEEQVQ